MSTADTAPTAAATPVLQVEHLRFAYPGQAPLFDGLGFVLPPGLSRLEADTGKSTLVRLLAGTLAASGGRFRLLGADWDPLAQPRRACHLDPRDPAWDALTPAQLALELRRRHAGFDEGAWQHHLEGFGLVEHAHKTLHMMSTGMRRKLALAGSLAAGAALTLLDEPTAGLDNRALDWLAGALEEAADDAVQAPGRAWLITAAWGLEDGLPWAQVVQA